MKRATHAVFAVAVLSLTDLWNSTSVALYALVAILASIAPDLDLKAKHRKTLHNVLVPLITSLVVYRLVLQNIPSGFYYILSLLIGWLSHIFLDILTVRRVYVTYPLTNMGLSLKLCKSDGILCNVVLLVVSLLLIICRATLMS